MLRAHHQLEALVKIYSDLCATVDPLQNSLRFTLTLAASPSRPVPSSSNEEGSGTLSVITRTESPGIDASVFQSILFGLSLSMGTRSWPASRPTSVGS